MQHKLPATLIDLFKTRMRDAKSEAKLLAWMMAAVGSLSDEYKELVPVLRRVPAARCQVQLVEGRHEVVRDGAGWICTRCTARASSEAALVRLERTSCAPTALQRLMARARQNLPYSASSASASLPSSSSEAIAVALRAADRVLGPEVGHLAGGGLTGGGEAA